MDSESDKGVSIVPANQKCSSIVHSNVTVASPGSSASSTNNKLNAMDNQNIENTKYDTIEAPKPMYGGIKNNLNKYIIKFKNYVFNVNAINEIDAIKIALKGKIYKTDFFLKILTVEQNKNFTSTYIIRGSKIKNKFIKI